MKYHKTLKTLPIGCFEQFKETNNLAWLCIFEYENFEPPEISESEKELLSEVANNLIYEMPSGILNTQRIDKLAEFARIEFELLTNKELTHNKYYFLKNKLNKEKFLFEKESKENVQKKSSLDEQCIFIEQVLNIKIDIFKRTCTQFYNLLTRAIEQNEKSNNSK